MIGERFTALPEQNFSVARLSCKRTCLAGGELPSHKLVVSNCILIIFVGIV